jgi:NAD(P)-dependent dehydrogenase (short-subunit alcohol dehydrogenase family)
MASRAFAPLLGADQTLTGKKGRIVNITSIAGKIGPPFAGAYVASKFALEGLSEVMRRELHLYGIGVVMVAPATVARRFGTSPRARSGAIGRRIMTTPSTKEFEQSSMPVTGIAFSQMMFAETVMKALTARRPRLRYSPAQHALLEQALPRMAPKRVTDFAVEQAIGLKPDAQRSLKGISA